MAINNENSSNKLSNDGRIPFTFRTDYYYESTGNEEIFDYDNLRNDRIKEVSGWAVRDASINNYDDEAANPGVYLSVQIGDRHGVTMIIPEQELLKILAEIQRVKVLDYDIRAAYYDYPKESKAFTTNEWQASTTISNDVKWDVSWEYDVDTEDNESSTVLCDCCFRG
jgi:hypothetical protein